MFYRYLVSYALILFIPMVIMLLMIQSFILPVLKHNIVETSINSLQDTSARFQNELETLQKIAYGISRDYDLTPFRLKENHLNGITKLQMYQQSNGFIHDLLYYIAEENRVFGAYNNVTVPMMTRSIYPFKQWNEDRFVQMMEQISQPELRAFNTGAGEEYVGYLYPLPPYQPYAIITFLISSDTIRSMFPSEIEESDRNGMILDSNNEIIVALHPDQATVMQQLDLIREELVDRTNKNLTISKDQYWITVIRSETGGLSYIYFTDKELVMKKVTIINRWIIGTISVIFLLGACLIYWFSRKHYSPIQNLLEKIPRSFDVKSDRGMKEFEFIGHAFDEIIQENISLHKSIEKYRPVFREYLFNELLHGREQINQFLSEKVIDEPTYGNKSYFQCIVVQITSEMNKSEAGIRCKEAIQAYGSDDDTTVLEAYFIDTTEKSKVVIIFSFIEEVVEQTAIIISDVFSSLNHGDGEHLLLGVGNVYGDILSIGQSYFEANKALELGLDPEKHIIFYEKLEDFDLSQTETAYPYDQLQALEEHIHQGREEGIRTTLQQIYSTVGASNVPRFLARCVVLDVLNVIIKKVIELKLDTKEFREQYLDNLIAAQVYDIKKLNHLLIVTSVEMCEYICDQIRKKNETFDEILAYIDKHYLEYDFTTVQLASHIGLTPSYLSLYFKERAGENLSNYLWNLRVTKAKHLLETTELTIKEIVYRVGYVDVSAFTRRFKSSLGVTPGEYRNKFKAN
ncbi:helix-turn-helix domain-containing protein [Paenibacillus sp. 1P07SE]|uniref:helix-turn-helix domain-containing protein n=1 Tax=Paenibacillus sp. 1P07SE TaxID=3132209 RepID=UPI0039A42A5C